MNDEVQETAAEQGAKVEPLTAEPKPTKPEKVGKVAKKAKAKSTKVKKAKKAPAKSTKEKKPSKTTKDAKPPKTAKPKLGKVPLGKFPRHPQNVFRPGSAYGAIFDAFILRKSGIRRDELTALAAEATGKDIKHSSYDLAVLLSAKDSNTGPRHPSCREGFWVKREGDCLTLKVD